jgi:hypothetical protein
MGWGAGTLLAGRWVSASGGVVDVDDEEQAPAAIAAHRATPRAATDRLSGIRRFYHPAVHCPVMFASRVLDGQTAIVTGGGTGIGFAVARGLGRLGARVVIARTPAFADAE